MQDEPTERSWMSRIVFAAALAGMAVLVVILSVQNRSLKRALGAERAERARHEGLASSRFVVGDVLPPFGLRAIDGASRRIEPGRGRSTLLLFYAEACTVCSQTYLKWEEVAPLFEDAEVDVVAVQLDRSPTSDPFAGPPGVESFALADLSEVPLAKLHAVPITLLLGDAGDVEFVHYGTMTTDDLGSLLAHLPPSEAVETGPSR